MSDNENVISTARTVSYDGSKDLQPRPISLIDTTVEGRPDIFDTTDERPSRLLSRKSTKTSVKEQLARRKYAKWRQDRFDTDEGDQPNTDDGNQAPVDDAPLGKTVPHEPHRESSAVDFAHAEQGEAQEASLTQDTVRKQKSLKHKENSEVDILYENQRGSFFCGIPLYSHSSLLQFDPSAWVTKDFKDSPVNITNAQVPDPSWTWSWKSWYVDMSGDVDEEGWQYSFAFGGKFAWHGTHPWFHSFVRRRRWLRKRVKQRIHNTTNDKPGGMASAHHLNADYFTIHSKQRDRSPGSARESLTARPASYVSYQSIPEIDESPEDIKDIASLLKALRQAKIDREKIDLVKQFAEDGGEELVYLEEQIPEIMSYLVFQNSKRQLLEFLKQTANEAQAHRDEHVAEEKAEGDAERRRIDNLLNAVKAADEQVKGLEFWSDRKHVLQTTDEGGDGQDQAFKNTFDQPSENPPLDANPAGEIKGISEKAEITMTPMTKIGLLDKGKRKAASDDGDELASNASDDKETRKSTKPSGLQAFGNDAMLVPDDDIDADQTG